MAGEFFSASSIKCGSERAPIEERFGLTTTGWRTSASSSAHAHSAEKVMKMRIIHLNLTSTWRASAPHGSVIAMSPKQKREFIYSILAGIFITNALMAEIIGGKIF